MRPMLGARSKAPRILSERLEGGRYVVALEGVAGSSYRFRVRAPSAEPNVATTAGGAATLGTAVGAGEWRDLTVAFPRTGANGDGYSAVTLTFRQR